MVCLILQLRDSAAWSRHIHTGVEGLDTLVADLESEEVQRESHCVFDALVGGLFPLQISDNLFLAFLSFTKNTL